MIIHRSESRGVADHGWLKSRHTFSFGDYYNPQRMSFGALRVINDDSVEAGRGFGTHPHKDMEIISIPLEGSLRHKDSEGNSSVICQGEVQIMSAGTGIFHSEFNASEAEVVKFLQIWVLPEKTGVKPRYEQKDFSHVERLNKIVTVVSPDGREGSVRINQNAFFSLTEIEANKKVIYKRRSPGNGLYVFMLKGQVELNGEVLNPRDGAGVSEFDSISLKALEQSEILLMEVPL